MTLFYTFRGPSEKTAKVLYSPEVFVFGKLKSDFEIFKQLILNTNPDQIIGIAVNSKIKGIRYESQVVNRFNSGKINKDGISGYKLHVPLGEKSNKLFTDSFCNWVGYKISEYLFSNKLTISHSFIHLPSSTAK